MKRSKKVLRNHFLRRLKVEREKYNRLIANRDFVIAELQRDLEKARKLNLTLDVENSELKKRIAILKTKRWYQYIAVSWDDLLKRMDSISKIPVTSMKNDEGTLLGNIDSSTLDKLFKLKRNDSSK